MTVASSIFALDLRRPDHTRTHQTCADVLSSQYHTCLPDPDRMACYESKCHNMVLNVRRSAEPHQNQKARER